MIAPIRPQPSHTRSLPPVNRSTFRRITRQREASRRRMASRLDSRKALPGFDEGPSVECYLTPGQAELERAWQALAFHAGDYSDRDPDSGAAWQYMGTFRDRLGNVAHQFRHRNRPAGAKPIPGIPRSYGRVSVTIPATRAYLADPQG